MLHIISPRLAYFITGSLYFLTLIVHSANPNPPSTYQSVLCTYKPGFGFVVKESKF